MGLMFGETFGERGGEGGTEITKSLGYSSDKGDLRFGGSELGQGKIVILEDSKRDGEALIRSQSFTFRLRLMHGEKVQREMVQ